MSVIKEKGTIKTQLNFFYLFGDQETGLTKAFAYTLAENRVFLFSFLRNMGIGIKDNESNFKKIEIVTEKVRGEHGRTDIEIRLKGQFHLVIEAKVGTNKVIDQQKQYLPVLSKLEEPIKIMCFISQINEHRISENSDIKIKNINWFYIDNLIDSVLSNTINPIDPILIKFQQYLRRFFTMTRQKEILIQDLGIESEIEKYKKYNLYRRPIAFGTPLYFCPYFTRGSFEDEGAYCISRVLGIISINIKDIDSQSITEELESFCKGFKDEILNIEAKIKKIDKGYNKEKLEEEKEKLTQKIESLITKWKNGIKEYTEEEKNLIDEEKDKDYTFYFLDDAVQMGGKAMKDNYNAKNWISRNIPPNRCISFTDLLTHLKFDKENINN